MYRISLAAVFIFLVSFSALSNAKGISAYLPLQMSPEIENRIDKLISLVHGAPITKPYKVSEVQHFLKDIQASHPALYRQVNRYLARFSNTSGVTHFGVDVAISEGKGYALPNQRGELIDSNYRFSVGAIAYFSPYLYASLGSQYSESGHWINTNSYLAFGYEYIQMEIGYREHWFSPFKDSAMLISTHAEASPSVTISNAMPISDWNVRYELFYSVLEPVDEIVLGDDAFPGRPRQAGAHISFSPLEFWTLGFNRTLQFGGGARDVGFSDVFEAFFNPAKKDNVGDENNADPNYEFGNQQASITSQFNVMWYLPMSLYVEYAGEDTLEESNFKLGNTTWSYGVFLPQVTQDVSARLEYSDVSSGWYVHHLYPSGYTNDGQIMGHWAASQRQTGVATAAKTYSLNLNWQLSNRELVNLTLRGVDNETGIDYQNSYSVQITYSLEDVNTTSSYDLFLGETVYGDKFSRLSLSYRW